MRTYKVVCFQSGNGWIVNASSEKRAMELVIESRDIYSKDDIKDLRVWEVFMNTMLEEVVEY